MKQIIRFLILCLSLSLLLPVVYAQDKSQNDLVKLNVSVWDSKLGYIKTLRPENFELYDGKERKQIDFFAKSTDEPASIGFIFDISGSMQGLPSKRRFSLHVAKGFEAFVQSGNPKNEYFLTTVGKDVRIPVEFTLDHAAILNGLIDIEKIEPKDQETRLYDAIGFAAQKLATAKYRTRILFVITDGLDFGSALTPQNVKKAIRQTGAEVNFLIKVDGNETRDMTSLVQFRQTPVLARQVSDLPTGGPKFGDSPPVDPNSSRLKDIEEIAAESGGRLLLPTDTREVQEVVQDLLTELQEYYVIGFRPVNTSKKGEWNKVGVKLGRTAELPKASGRIFIRARRGYLQ